MRVLLAALLLLAAAPAAVPVASACAPAPLFSASLVDAAGCDREADTFCVYLGSAYPEPIVTICLPF